MVRLPTIVAVTAAFTVTVALVEPTQPSALVTVTE
jgi:hypothetical protein